MRNKSNPWAVGAAVGMLLLIMDSKTAISGAKDGLDLCIRTVIPSLFPFFVLSSMVVGSVSGSLGWLGAILRRVCHIPQGTEGLLLVGLLGGYPVGARVVSSAVDGGRLSAEDGRRMITFCNNAGPSFIFGMAGLLFQDIRISCALWAIQILSALTTGFILPAAKGRADSLPPGIPISPDKAVREGMGAMGNVCAWIVLFRIVIAFLDRWALWLLPEWGRVLILGILELSNGVLSLEGIGDTGLRFLLCSTMISLGGLCVLMQTVSEAKQINIKQYLTGKLIQTGFSTLLSFGFAVIFFQYPWVKLVWLPVICVLILTAAFVFLRKSEKSGSNPVLVVV